MRSFTVLLEIKSAACKTIASLFVHCVLFTLAEIGHFNCLKAEAPEIASG